MIYKIKSFTILLQLNNDSEGFFSLLLSFHISCRINSQENKQQDCESPK